MTKDRIYWTDREEQIITDKIIQLKEDDPLRPIMSIIKEAQQELPTNRRRNIPSINIIPSIKTKVEVALKKHHRDKEQILDELSEDEILVYFKDIVLRNLSVDDLFDNLNEDFIIKVLDKFRLSVLVGYVAKRYIEESSPLATESFATESPEPETKTEPSPVKRKTKVVVAGVKQNQKVELKARAPHLDLRFLPNTFNGDLPKAEYCIAWTNFMSHSLWDLLQKSGIHVIPVTGGLTTIVSRLKDIK